jgi:metallo-beta-lactamase family protein
LKISFHGADREVTGSCHLLQAAGKRILIDCGFYQGSRRLDEENGRELGFDAGSVDFLLLTHAHLDHCGRIPLLVKRGFRGEIVATVATRELARVVMLDATHLQEEEHKRELRHAERRGEAETSPAPLYMLVDTLNAFDRFGRNAVYRQPLPLADGLVATFHDSGHILGSASVAIEAEGRKIVFSGDLGNPGRPLLRDPDPPQGADVAVMESTYGDRRHMGLGESLAEFYEALNIAFHAGGNVIIPTFALERAQELLFWIRDGVETNKLSPAMHLFLDSPMAISATEIFARYPDEQSPVVAKLLAKGVDPFAPPNLKFTRERAESEALNRVSGGAVILAGSGMATGGRVVHHLRHNLGRPAASVIFVGFAAKGTLAREIIDGARAVRVLGDEIRVRARIHTINGFSAHADQAELMDWHARVGAPRTFLTHGEPAAMQALAVKLKGEIAMPAFADGFEL